LYSIFYNLEDFATRFDIPHNRYSAPEGGSMRIKKYSDVQPTYFNNDVAKGVAGRVVIGKNDGARNFCMRVFEIGPEGNTPKHAHEWEHEIFVHSGEAEILNAGKWNKIKAGDVVLIPGNEEHQMRNPGKEKFTFVCLIPSSAPEL
jgi:quercetin dioxygenase-like cupin family protein